jgi:hypothetical protein
MKSLSMAYQMKKNAQKKAMGGEVHPDELMESRKARLHKLMHGGMVECHSEGGMAGEQLEDHMAEKEDFLSDEGDDEMAMPFAEGGEVEDPMEKRKKRLSMIMGELHAKHYGK